MNQRLEGSNFTDDVLAERLRQLRKQAGLSQKALAERLGISGPAVAQWEMGRHRPDTRWLPKLASLLNCQPSDLRPDLFQFVAASLPVTASIAALPYRQPSATQSATQSATLHESAHADTDSETTADSAAIDWAQHADLVRMDPDSTETVMDAHPPSSSMPYIAAQDHAHNHTSDDHHALSPEKQENSRSEALLFSPLQLRRARQQRRLERRELAALLHVDAFKIQQWEQGSATPNDWQSHRLAQVLGLRQSQSRTMSNRVKFTVLQAPNAVRVPILPIYTCPPSDSEHVAVGHMPALHAQATVVFRLPAGRWEMAGATTWLHVQVSPCQAIDLSGHVKAIRVIEGGLCLRERIVFEGQVQWFAPASRFGAAERIPLLPDEWVWRVWAVVSLSDDELPHLASTTPSEWSADT